MKATFIGDETAMSAVTSYLSYHIEQVINSSKIQQNGIEQALYLGSRYIPVAASPPPLISAGSSKEANNSNGSSVALASTFSVLVVLLVVLAVFAMVRRKRQQPPDKVETIPPLDDLEKQQVLVTGGGNDSGAVQHPPSIVTVSKSLASGEFNDESSDQAMAGGGFLESVHNVGQQYDDNEVPSSSPPYPMSSAYSITTARTSSTTKDSSVGESFGLEDDITEKIANVKPMDVKVVDVEVPSSVPPSVVDILPPKHPAGSSQKPPVPSVVGSKRRKKKKKKKKKLALVRSSSRENVSEMETIAEGEEETSGDMDDDGSEYSWCSTSDSDPGSNPGSRDPSPSRSREPSPSRPGSDGANLTPVPSLSWDYSNIGLAATSSDGEQNKANRLPPKWI